MVFVPFYVSTSYTTTALYTIVKTGVAASTVTMGIYAATPGNSGTFSNFPTGSALAVGSVATTANNSIVNVSIVTTLSANTLYWAAIQASTSTTLALCIGLLNFGIFSYTTANGGSTSFVTKYYDLY